VRWPKGLCLGVSRQETPAETEAFVAQTSSRRSWTRGLEPGVSEGQVAAAACVVARCGTWLPANCGHLLKMAIRRNSLSPDAGALWLCAVGQSGLQPSNATGIPDSELAGTAEEVLLGSVGSLADDESSNDYDSLSAARAVWGLCAMDKTDAADGLAKRILKRLKAEDSSAFVAETWALLREVDQTLASEGDGDGDDSGPDWKEGITKAGDEEVALSRPGRLAELKQALTKTGEEVTDMEEGLAIGPYSVLLRVGSHSVALDFDAHESPVNRALRRKQWATLSPDLRVAEITAGSWDGLTDRARAALFRRRLLDEEDPVADEGDDD